MLSKLSITQLY